MGGGYLFSDIHFCLTDFKNIWKAEESLKTFERRIFLSAYKRLFALFFKKFGLGAEN